MGSEAKDTKISLYYALAENLPQNKLAEK